MAKIYFSGQVNRFIQLVKCPAYCCGVNFSGISRMKRHFCKNGLDAGCFKHLDAT